MKVAHFALVTPKRCGLYETTRELVAGLREIGVDSRIFDPNPKSHKLHPGGTEDRGAVFCDESFLKEADVWVSHSGIGKWEGTTNTPVVYVAHGRPRNSFLTENKGGTPIYSYMYNKDKDHDFKGVVTFWPEHAEYLKFMFKETPVHCVPSCVDMNYWTPGDSDYDFAGKSGKINVVITDSWRDDVDPFLPINAIGMWARAKQDVKVHIYAATQIKKGWAALIKRLQDDGTLGLIQEWAGDLRIVYRAADMALTGNSIEVRTVREAMACGCPVVRVSDVDISRHYPQFDQALLTNRKFVRQQALSLYDPRESAKTFLGVLESAVTDKTKRYA